jgi:prevent-host-death family protein
VLGPNQKGNVAEIAIALEATRHGIQVLKPVAEHCRYDLAFDLGSRILRVQCKWARLDEAVIYADLVAFRQSTRGPVRKTYSSQEVDAVALYCDQLQKSYLVPARIIDGRSAIQLRLQQPRNAQRAAINWAEQYLLSGAVAQLGERRHGMAEVRGSSPLSSTAQRGDEIVVGAHRFRNHFGYWMERAAAGEQILITRRGRRYARLGPPDPPPTTTDTAPAEVREAVQAAAHSDTARTSP